GRDADDYYDFISSSSGSDDEDDAKEEDDNGSAARAIRGDKAAGSRATGDVAELTSVPLDADAARVPSAVFTRIGVPSSSRSSESSRAQPQRPPSHQRNPDLLARVATGAVSLAGGMELHVAPESLAQHATRKSQLESALDALSLTSGASTSRSSNNSTGSGGDGVVVSGEAPFRFRAQAASADVEMTGAEGPVRPAASGAADRTRSKASGGSDGADPLYDEGLDDADEKWYRASAAVNCRVKKDEILTYASGAATASSLPFHKRLNVAAAARAAASGASLSLLSSANEFYPVVCSDCGTTVGVLDRQQHYHFFNVLPSNC
ncbi:hypothetical protein PybrP1_001476, partial [[Pythium] brassicae (nom. inval.)]